jgi:hypothetical protein
MNVRITIAFAIALAAGLAASQPVTAQSPTKGASAATVHKGRLATRAPKGVPDSIEVRQARLDEINRRFDRNHPSKARSAPRRVTFQEPRAGRTPSRLAAPAGSPGGASRGVGSTARHAVRLSPTGTTAATSRVPRPAAATRSASPAQRYVGSTSARPAAPRSTARTASTTRPVRGIARTASPVRPTTVAPRAAAAQGRVAAAGPGRAVHPGVRASRIAVKGAAGGALVGGAIAIAAQEIADPGRTLRDLRQGNVDKGEVAAIGAAAMAGGILPGLAAYGAVKIVDQEIRDPGKTSRDIKGATGIDLERTGKDIEGAAKDVGAFFGKIFP